MLELVSTEAAIIACHGAAELLDALAPAAAVFRARVAPDELWLVCDRASRTELLAGARARVSPGLVLDQTDGWSAWTLRGPDAREALSRLMLAPIPSGNGPALVQGAIAGVPGKVIVDRETFHLFVPAPVGHHLRARVLAVSGDLGVEQGAAEPFAVSQEQAASC